MPARQHREVPLEVLMGALVQRLRTGPASIDDLLISMAKAAGAAVQLSDPAGPAAAAALMMIGDRFADVMSDFADRVEIGVT
jgi:hypothetical protein